MNAAPVTDNDSGRVASDVSCYECEQLSKRFDRGIRGLDRRHCTGCHCSRHFACASCGACLPDWHRWDRWYCSTTCRGRVRRERVAAQFERAAWEAEHPEEAATQRAEWEEWRASLRVLGAALGGGRSDRQVCEDALKDRAECCGYRKWGVGDFACGATFGPADTIYRRRRFPRSRVVGDGQEVVHYCDEHRCPHSRAEHEELRPGYTFRNCMCDPKEWDGPRPCEVCGRQVAVELYMHRGAVADRYRWDNVRHRPEEHRIRWVCGRACGRVIERAEAASRRLADRQARGNREPQVCETCRRPFRSVRVDARHCSNACRQRAFRQRKANGEPIV